MKFVTFDANGQERLGVVDAKRGILDLQKASSSLPGTMIAFIEAGQAALDEAKKVVSRRRRTSRAGCRLPAQSSMRRSRIRAKTSSASAATTKPISKRARAPATSR